MIKTVLSHAFFFLNWAVGESVEYSSYPFMSRHDYVYVTSKFMKPSELNSFVYSIKQFSVLMPLQYLIFFSGLTLECQLVILQSPERFSYT